MSEYIITVIYDFGKSENGFPTSDTWTVDSLESCVSALERMQSNGVHFIGINILEISGDDSDATI